MITTPSNYNREPDEWLTFCEVNPSSAYNLFLKVKNDLSSCQLATYSFWGISVCVTWILCPLWKNSSRLEYAGSKSWLNFSVSAFIATALATSSLWFKIKEQHYKKKLAESHELLDFTSTEERKSQFFNFLAQKKLERGVNAFSYDEMINYFHIYLQRV